MKTTQILSLSVLAAALIGCAAPSVVKPYIGQQESWATSPGAVMEPGTVIPAYHGNPPKPYTIIGELSEECRYGSAIVEAARRAQASGADAVIVLSSGEKVTGYDTPNMIAIPLGRGLTHQVPIGGGNAITEMFATVRLIKWKE